MNINILQESDLADISLLLIHYNLITQDIDLKKQFFIGIKHHHALIAIGALECHRPYALIRSVAVSPEQRRKGFATRICQALFQQALTENISQLYLLTQNADDFFSKQGFVLIDRDTAPQSIKTTSQFSRLCPDDANVMKRQLIPLAGSEDGRL